MYELIFLISTLIHLVQIIIFIRVVFGYFALNEKNPYVKKYTDRIDPILNMVKLEWRLSSFVVDFGPFLLLFLMEIINQGLWHLA